MVIGEMPSFRNMNMHNSPVQTQLTHRLLPHVKMRPVAPVSRWPLRPGGTWRTGWPGEARGSHWTRWTCRLKQKLTYHTNIFKKGTSIKMARVLIEKLHSKCCSFCKCRRVFSCTVP